MQNLKESNENQRQKNLARKYVVLNAAKDCSLCIRIP